MNWAVAFGAGAGLGLAYFGGLWLTVVGVLRRPSRLVWVPVSGVVRLVLLGVALAALTRIFHPSSGGRFISSSR